MPRVDSTIVLLKEDIQKMVKGGQELYIELGPGVVIPIRYEKGPRTMTAEPKLACIIADCSKQCKNAFGLKKHLEMAHKNEAEAKKWVKEYKK